MDRIKVWLERWWVLLLLLAALPFFYSTAISNEKSVNYLNNDFFTFWLSGHLLSTGAQPYSSADWVGGHHANGATWIPNQVFPYPLPLALLMLPLGVLSLQQAYIAWGIFSQLLILATIVWMAMNWSGFNQRIFAVLLLMAALLNSNIHLMLLTGTISTLFLMFLMLALYFFQRENYFAGGVALSLLALKPTFLAIAALICLWLLFRRKWWALGGIAGGGLGLLVVGLLQDVQWVAKFRAAGENLFNLRLGSQPTLISYARLACRADMSCALAIYLFAVLVLVGVFAWLAWKQRDALTPLTVFSLAIPLGLVLAPYIWSYDYALLLIPICYICFELVRRRASLVPATLFLIVLDLLSLAMVTLFWLNPESPALTIQRDMWSIWVGILVLISAGWMVLGLPTGRAAGQKTA